MELRPKPAYGDPCNNCGLCCIAVQCPLWNCPIPNFWIGCAAFLLVTLSGCGILSRIISIVTKFIGL
jgi:hypothetical protein